MALSELRQLIILLYEYLVNRGSRLEADYIELLDDHYKRMFSTRPELRIDESDLLKIIERKAQFDLFCEIQKDIHEIISLYRDSAFGDVDKNDQG